jgi:hypothetical protein
MHLKFNAIDTELKPIRFKKKSIFPIFTLTGKDKAKIYTNPIGY